MKAVLKSDGIQLVRVESGALFVMIAGILGKVLQVSSRAGSILYLAWAIRQGD